MIFVVETEERTLIAFHTEAEAIANCEGLDVEAAIWLFWSDRGEPLKPEFSVPNRRGMFVVENGIYSLVPATPDHHANLDEALDEILNFESPPPFNSAEAVRTYLQNQGRV
ncbi:hypothetical protein H3H36_15200 [Duganella sp. FT3S]|uniref:Uncharacterized protein n=1 Tax=Rugamonas fusca TaxID=2758568 RepID=A0A7W2EJ01_9BURK|nr:hypothetical protein [Rugamonas fusca]MBA5606704.1 hypothetical protein [Rugamonas fusca]